MSAYLSSNGIELWHVAGWTMVHFLWLGALVAAAATICRFFLRRTSPNIRYAFMLAWLIALAALPIGTAAWICRNSPPFQGGAGGGFVSAAIQTATSPASIQTRSTSIEPTIELHDRGKAAQVQNAVVAEKEIPPLSGATLGAEPSPSPSLRARGISIAALESCIPYLPWLWLIGTPITFALLLTGVVGTRRLNRASRTITEGPIAELLAQLITSLRIGKRVTVAVCDRIAAPVLIGILRPIILLPPAALTGWSPDEIEMVLLHELAHVRRWDNLMNLLQRLVESLLFFHPAVWLISGWIRSDRESCCDAVVVLRTNRPHAYAEMLVALAAQMPRSVLFHPAASSAMAAGPLRSRIRRILQLEDDPMLVSGKSLALMFGALLVAVTLGVLYVPAIGQAEESATEDTEKKTKTEQSSDAADPAPEPVLVPQNFALKRNKAGETRLYLNGVPIGHDVVRAVIPKSPNLANKVRVTISVGKAADSNEVEKLVNLLKSLGVKKLAVNSTLDEAASPEDLTKDDHWPAGIVFASPKEGEISARAWRELGIKIVRAIKDEQAAEHSSSLKVIEVRRTTGTMSLDRMLLLSLNDIETRDFDQLSGAMSKLNDPKLIVAKCVFNTPQGPTFTEIALDSSAPRTAAAPPGQIDHQRPTSSKASARFPSLEDQKLADQAWKSLSLELEPIGADDLKRVKALGYDGGVKVVSGSAGLQGLVDKTIQPGDILIGLHVWPTMSMKDVATVLDRDDLSELNPLKFYVVRNGLIGGTPEKPIVADTIRTGRVSAALDGGGFGGRTRSTRSGSSNAQPAPADPNQVPSPTPATIQTPHYPAPIGLPPSSSATTPQPVVAENSAAFSSAIGLTDIPPSGLPGPAHGTNTDVQPNKSNLRYDGKTFDGWRNEWQTELSTKKRLEAVNALAAFGRAGFGKQAVEAILDVAGEYDFNAIDNTAEGSIKNAVLNQLAPYVQAQPTAKHWVPSLAARLAKEPRKWQSPAIALLHRLQTEDKDTIAIIRSLAEDGPEGVRGAALGALVRSKRLQSGGPRIDDATQALLTAALKSKDPAVILSALNLLYYQPTPGGIPGAPQLVFQPELVPLLFHSDKRVQQFARNMLASIQDDDAPQLVESLLAILKDDSRKADRIAAIRALGAIGPKAAFAQTQVEQIFSNVSQDMPLRVATGFAIDKIEGGQRLRNELMNLINRATDEKVQTQINQLYNAEQQATNE